MRTPPLLIFSWVVAIDAAPQAIISQGRGGKLVYDADEHGNRVPDFSTCGHAGGDGKDP